MATGGGEGTGIARHLPDLGAVLDAIADYAVATLDVDGTVTSWNHGAEVLTGYARDEVVGRPASAYLADEDGEEGSVERALRDAGETGRARFESWRTKKGGERYLADAVTAPLLDGAGAVSGYVEVARDVTEHRRTEAMYRGLVESAPDATVVAESDGRIALANRQAEELFGYRRDELVGQEVEILVPQRFRHRHPDHRSGFFADPRARPMGAGLELYAMRRDGTEFPVEISLSPLQTDRGVVVSAAIRDATDRRRQLEQLRRQRDEILELSTPVIQVWDKVLALPIIGTLDSARAALLTESLLERIGQQQAEIVILDISGVPTIDTLVAQHLLRTVQAATLMGAASIMSGIRPETAQAMVHLGIDLGQLRSRATLRDALQLALQMVRDRADVAGRATSTLGGEGPS